MKRIVDNKYLDALLKLILFSAIIHLAILSYHMIATQDISIMNYFNVLDLDFFFPEIAQGLISNILSVVVMIIIYIAFLFLTKSK